MSIQAIRMWKRSKKRAFWWTVFNSILFVLVTLTTHFGWVSLVAAVASVIYFFYSDFKLRQFSVPVLFEFNITSKETCRIKELLYQYRAEYIVKEDCKEQLNQFITDSIYKNNNPIDIPLFEYFNLYNEGLYCINNNSFINSNELEATQKEIFFELKKNNPIAPIQNFFEYTHK